ALHDALAEGPFKWKIIVISACYAGSFIPKLKDDNTLIITAAAADRNSFGCSDENDLTYFGDAFLKQALPVSRSWPEAYQKAVEYVSTREKAEGDKPSLPQIYVGKNIAEYLSKKSR
ncbi:MAG TPA: C13 family peptidase, partial [Patescibacteria group bacterium]|nr:C13 family peptidase [Patescibacteria group bacterium]